MKLTLCAMVGLLPLSGFATAVCMRAPLEKNIAEAQSVFIATITNVSMSKKLSELRDKERYSVRYGFEVARLIKGDPSIASALVTAARFDDPSDKIFRYRAEQSRYVPGDSVLVVADEPGDVPISSIDCTPSRPWDGDAYRRTAPVPGFVP